MFLIEVSLPLPLFKSFHYLSDIFIPPGVRVVVPFGKQTLVGIVWNAIETTPDKLDPTIEYKEIIDVLDPLPLYPPKFFPFLEWISKYYHTPLGLVLKMALPSGVFKMPERRIYLTEEGEKALKKGTLPQVFTQCLKGGANLKTFLKKNKLKLKDIKNWERLGLLLVKSEIPRVKLATEVFYRLVKRPKGELGESLAQLFGENLELPAYVLREKIASKELKRLLREGYLERLEFPKMRRITLPTEPLRDYVLTPTQRGILQQLEKGLYEGKGQIFLLHGVTGSGKSLIYLELIKRVLAQGKRVLFLLPEIALTHYIERLLFDHFKGEIAVLHSALTSNQRFSEWMKVLEGRAKIVLGTRSAIFAPVEGLGLIIVDEEHDPSYKEENLPCKYQARDLAILRGKREGAMVLLGSATPSIKSYFYARRGVYNLLTLKERPFVKMPEVKLVKLKPKEWVSKEVLYEIEKTLAKGKSLFVYLNRRGYAPLVRCEECGYVWACPNCGIPLTYHKSEERLLCHYCAFEIGSKILCPNCSSPKQRYFRLGTERVEEEFQRLFPGVEILRFDRDTVTSEKKLNEILNKLYDPRPKIIVGTQMGVHGHNFPQVNLVIVLRAEEGLFLPHYKAEERTFQLLLQAEGRAGRKDERGKVIIQTAMPEHYVINLALKQDYETFFQEELLKRKKYGFPPFKRLALFKMEAASEERLIEKATKLKMEMETFKEQKNLSLEILGPSPAPLRKLRGKYRWFLLLKSDSHRDLHILLDAFKDVRIAGINIELDVDPEDLL